MKCLIWSWLVLKRRENINLVAAQECIVYAHTFMHFIRITFFCAATTSSHQRWPTVWNYKQPFPSGEYAAKMVEMKWIEKYRYSHSFCAEHVYAIKQNKQNLKQIELKIADTSRCIYALASVRFDWTAFSVISIQFHFIISSWTSNYLLYSLTGALDCPWCQEFSTVFFKMLFY